MYKLFAGSAHPQLNQEIARLLRKPLAKAEVVRFGNSEVKVTIQDEVRNTVCYVIQPTTNPTDTNLMELCFYCDALRREEASQVIALIPYFGYAKQNNQHRVGECVSVNVVIRFLEAIGFAKVYTIDLHNEATAGVFSIPFKNLSAVPLLANATKTLLKKKKIGLNEIALVSPDQGAIERTRHFGEALFNKSDFEITLIEKKRDQHVAHKAEALAIYGHVKDKVAIIVDDMIVSGSTLKPAVEICKEQGAKHVFAAVTHHDFTADAPERISQSGLECLITTNTIPLKPEQKIRIMTEVSVASLLAAEIGQ